MKVKSKIVPNKCDDIAEKKLSVSRPKIMFTLVIIVQTMAGAYIDHTCT